MFDVSTCMENGCSPGCRWHAFDGFLFCAVLFSTRCLGGDLGQTELSQFLRLFLPTLVLIIDQFVMKSTCIAFQEIDFAKRLLLQSKTITKIIRSNIRPSNPKGEIFI